MNAKEATNLLDNLVFSQKGQHLNIDRQAFIQGILEGLKHKEITETYELPYLGRGCYFMHNLVYPLERLLREVLMQAEIISPYETEIIDTFLQPHNTNLWECVRRVAQQSVLSETANSTQETVDSDIGEII